MKNKSNDQKETFETVGEAVTRLLGRLDARHKNHRATKPEQIHSSPGKSLVSGEERAPETDRLSRSAAIKISGDNVRLSLGGGIAQTNSNVIRLAANKNRWLGEEDCVAGDEGEWLW